MIGEDSYCCWRSAWRLGAWCYGTDAQFPPVRDRRAQEPRGQDSEVPAAATVRWRRLVCIQQLEQVDTRRDPALQQPCRDMNYATAQVPV